MPSSLAIAMATSAMRVMTYSSGGSIMNEELAYSGWIQEVKRLGRRSPPPPPSKKRKRIE